MIQLISFDRDKAIAAGMTITSVRRPPSPSPELEHPPETIVRIPHTPFVAEDRGTPDRIMIRPSTSLGVFFLKVWLRTNMIPHENLPTAAERKKLGATAMTEDEVADPQQQEAEPVAVIGDAFSILWIGREPIATIIERNKLKIGDELYARPPKPAAQQHVPDVDEMYARFCVWCHKNKGLDLDPRLHTHSGNPVSAGAYISDHVTLIAFRAFRAGQLYAAGEEP